MSFPPVRRSTFLTQAVDPYQLAYFTTDEFLVSLGGQFGRNHIDMYASVAACGVVWRKCNTGGGSPTSVRRVHSGTTGCPAHTSTAVATLRLFALTAVSRLQTPALNNSEPTLITTERSPSLPYVVPFAVFMGLLVLLPVAGLSPRADAIVRVTVVSLTLWLAARHAIDLRVQHWLGTLAVGVGVFLIWIAPDMLVADWRTNALFQNSVTGSLTVSMPPEARHDVLVLVLRVARAALLVPVLEELFWRAWLPRFLDAKDFRTRPLGSYTTLSFVATAILFAAEHGPFWEVGLAAGVIYNWWMARTKSLGDLIVAHGITNLLLSLFVLGTERWEYWM